MPATPEPQIHNLMHQLLRLFGVIEKRDAKGLTYKFRSIEDFVDQLHVGLGETRIVLKMESDIVHYGTIPRFKEGKEVGVLVNAVVKCVYTFTAPDGSSTSSSALGEGVDERDKAISKAQTFALKTCVGQIFAVPFKGDAELDPDFDDTDEANPTPSAPPRQRPADLTQPAAPEETTPTLLDAVFNVLRGMPAKQMTDFKMAVAANHANYGGWPDSHATEFEKLKASDIAANLEWAAKWLKVETPLTEDFDQDA